MTKIKRTYNLSAETVRSVRELTETYGVAPTQDAAVELAVAELRRRLLDEAEASAWEAASRDVAFRRESEDLERAYRAADAETWPQ